MPAVIRVPTLMVYLQTCLAEMMDGRKNMRRRVIILSMASPPNEEDDAKDVLDAGKEYAHKGPKVCFDSGLCTWVVWSLKIENDDFLLEQVN